jgi:hypothetical protein
LLVKDDAAADLAAQFQLLLVELNSVQDDALVQPVSDGPPCESAVVKPEDDIPASLLVKDETAADLAAQVQLLLIELDSVQDDALVQPVLAGFPRVAPDASESALEIIAAVPNLDEQQMPAELIPALPNELITTVEAPGADAQFEDMQPTLISKESGRNESPTTIQEHYYNLGNDPYGTE